MSVAGAPWWFLGRDRRVLVPLEPRAPLPPMPTCASCSSPYAYWQTLPWRPPSVAAGDPPMMVRDFLRGDFWGVELEGLPIVPGGSTKAPSSTRVLTYFLDRWSPDWQRRILETHASYGYTHFLLSEADSRGPTSGAPYSPGPPGNGRTLSQFVDTLGLVAAYLPYPIVAIGSKCFNPKDQSAQQWIDYAGPIMEACDGLAQEYTVWEWNLWNVPGQTTIDAFKAMGQMAHAQGASFWAHFSCHYTSWFADGDPRGRFGFWEDLGDDVDGVNYQSYPAVCGWPWSPPRSDQAWDAGDLQARLVDTLWQFGESGNRWKIRAYELCAIAQYDAPHPTEDEGDTMGYLACCTSDNVKHTDARVWGFGNGGRRPDGSPI